MRFPLLNKLLAVLFCTGTLLVSASASATVIVTGTRVIYPSDAREVTVKLNNNGTVPALVQSWIDSGNLKEDPNAGGMPFTLMPPVTRIDPDKGQSLRLIYTHDPLPQDRESVFWLNVLEIPPKPAKADVDQRLLQVAFRTRIKIFFRPTGLKGEANEAPAKLSWAWEHDATNHNKLVLRATNPTPYHVSVVGAKVTSGGKTYESDSQMVAPLSNATFAFKDLERQPDGPLKVNFETVNDYGAIVPAAFPASSN
ncbi:fimbrial chaperone [Paraburkholderia aspalathi]|uniref:fimbrial chaperone n=1 Tax=Paraburkholderia aspalathi TaxID=1324617 RepID=UPI0038B742F9